MEQISGKTKQNKKPSPTSKILFNLKEINSNNNNNNNNNNNRHKAPFLSRAHNALQLYTTSTIHNAQTTIASNHMYSAH